MPAGRLYRETGERGAPCFCSCCYVGSLADVAGSLHGGVRCLLYLGGGEVEGCVVLGGNLWLSGRSASWERTREGEGCFIMA